MLKRDSFAICRRGQKLIEPIGLAILIINNLDFRKHFNQSFHSYENFKDSFHCLCSLRYITFLFLYRFLSNFKLYLHRRWCLHLRLQLKETIPLSLQQIYWVSLYRHHTSETLVLEFLWVMEDLNREKIELSSSYLRRSSSSTLHHHNF